MSHTLMLVPTNPDVGLTTVTLGLVRAIDNQGLKLNFFKPVAQREPKNSGTEHSTSIVRCNPNLNPPDPIPLKRVKQLLSQGNWDLLLEEVVERYEMAAKDCDIIVIEGLVSTKDQPYATRLNAEIAKALDTEIILVSALLGNTLDTLNSQIEMTAQTYGGLQNSKVLGCIFNKIGAPKHQQPFTYSHSETEQPSSNGDEQKLLEQSKIFKQKGFKCLGIIPWKAELTAPRVKDIATFLNADILHEGEINERRVLHATLCARDMPNMLNALNPNTLVITSGDRSDIILVTCMAVLNGVKIPGLLLTGGYTPDPNIITLCEQAIETGLPILSIKSDSFRTALQLPQFDAKLPLDDLERIESVKNFTAEHIDAAWIKTLAETHYERRLSPPAFRHQLMERARAAQKTIVLPEGDEPRTLQAAVTCTHRGIATCILLGEKETIHRVAEHNGIELPEGIQIVEPNKIRERYIEPMVKLREHKGLNAVVAAEHLQDNVILGTMMLQQGDVDGLVSGAVHTTANTILPAFQLIKTAPTASIISSIFFMCLPDQVLVYGDCAVNPDPDAKQLADIAIQSADSAKMFGITPRVAMISYSTGQSGQGSDVDKVRQATAYVKEQRPDILVDGPLQYDAALIESVAKKKAPDSPVAGQATVCIFPDLNTGNTTYKAVQRSADVICIGPMLQGLNKPVNDLSRGALVDDILFTIALTAIQAV